MQKVAKENEKLKNHFLQPPKTKNQKPNKSNSILTMGRYMKSKYNEKVYKIPISLKGFTCPNIDGSKARGGCVFCENESFSPNLKEKTARKFFLNNKNAKNPLLDLQLSQLKKQFSATKKRLQKKFGAKKFLVYFQSFSNTYAPMDTLKTLYKTALAFDDVVGISIGTRADSIDTEIIDWLGAFTKKHEIWIEYGVQSIFDKTLDKINRAEKWADIEKMLVYTKSKNIKVCAHLIFGLPDETSQMMLKSTQKMADLRIDAIKFHPLYVTQKTQLANWYSADKFSPMTKKAYIKTLIKALKILPSSTIIQRVTAGIQNESLIAPKWCYEKHALINEIRAELKNHSLIY